MKKYHLPLMPVIWAVVCLIIGALVAIGLYGYYSAERAMADQFNRQQLAVAQQAALGMEEFLAKVRLSTTLLARVPGGQERRGQEENLRILYGQLGEGIDFIFRADDRGRLSASYPPGILGERLGKDFSFRSYAQRAKSTGEPVVAHVPAPSEEATPAKPPRFGSVLVVAPIFHGSEFAGFLGCGLDMKKIYDRFVHPILFGAEEDSWMITHEGRFIVHSDPAFLGQDAFTARRERDPDLSSEQIDRIMREGMLAGKAGMGQYTSGSHRGERGRTTKLIAYAPIRIDGQRWSLAVIVPYPQVTQVVWGSFKISAVLIIVMACTLLAGTYVGHKINQERIRAGEKVKWGEEILRSQNRLQALFDGAPDAITIVDRDYHILMVNKTALNWYQRPLEGFVGKPCHKEFQDRAALCPNCPAEESFRTGQPAFRERASLVAGGAKHYLQLFTFPLRDLNGEVVEVVEYVKDVTAEKDLQQQIIQSERLAIVGRMSANVAHEIKNPLGTIVLNAELLEEELDRLGGKDTAEARELLGVIKSEVDRLLEVLEEYLQFARLPQVKLETGNVNEVISDLLLFLREEVAERKMMLVEEYDSNLPPVQLDPKQLRQAFLNLMKNSFDAMPDGGKLTISTAQKDGKVEISFGDTGKGISEADQELIFTPFFSTKHGGTGLGLSITAHIVQEHRGTISFQSYPGLGTTFNIRLPILPLVSIGSEGERAHPVGEVASA